jgi:phosphatidylglycerophosphate synthase
MNVADMMDGATARAGNTCTPFGTVFDHTIDRYAEFMLIAGFMAGGWISPLLGIFTAAGVVMASYVRTKAESVSDLKLGAVGFAGREEKLLLMMASLVLFAFSQPLPGKILIFLVGLVSHITVLQRLLFTRKKMLAGQPTEGGRLPE